MQVVKRSRFSDEQIIGILKEHQAGLCCKHELSNATFYKGRSKYDDREMPETKPAERA